MAKNEDANTWQNDRMAAEQFQLNWHSGTLSLDDPVVKMVNREARRRANHFNILDWWEDLANDMIGRLADGKYEGKGSLEGFIRTCLRYDAIKVAQKEGRFSELTEGLTSDQLDTAKCVERRLFSEKFMGELLKNRPDLQKRVIELILEAEDNEVSTSEGEEPEDKKVLTSEGKVNQRAVARKLGVSRYQVDVALKQLKPVLVRLCDKHHIKLDATNIAAKPALQKNFEL